MRATGPGQSALLLMDVIDILNSREVPYAVIGSFAVSFYGAVRASVDADAVVSLGGPKDADDLCAFIRTSGLTAERNIGDPDDPIAEVIRIADAFNNRVDLLAGIRGMTRKALTRAVETRFMGHAVRIIGIEDLIAMKLFAGSPQDLEDCAGIVLFSGKAVNAALLQDITTDYGPDCARRLASFLKTNPL